MRIVVHIDLVFENGSVYTRPIGWTPVPGQGVQLKPQDLYEMVCKSFEQNVTDVPMSCPPSAITRGARLSSQAVPVVAAQDDKLLTQIPVSEFGMIEGMAINAYKLVGRARFLECIEWVRMKIKLNQCRNAAALFQTLINKTEVRP